MTHASQLGTSDCFWALRRCRRVVAICLLLSSVLFPMRALADNCSSLSDCFYTIAVALATIAAITLLVALIIGTGGGGGLALAGGGLLRWSVAATVARLTNAAAAAAAAAAASAAAGQTISMMSNSGTPGNNQAQNRQFRDAIQEAERRLGRKLDKGQIRRVHDEISGENLGFDEIVDTVLGMFG